MTGCGTTGQQDIVPDEGGTDEIGESSLHPDDF